MSDQALQERERQHARLRGWSVVLKVAAVLSWVRGLWYFFTEVKWFFGLRRYEMPSDALLNLFYFAVGAFVVGVAFWAASLVLISMAHIEENTRPPALGPNESLASSVHGGEKK